MTGSADAPDPLLAQFRADAAAFAAGLAELSADRLPELERAARQLRGAAILVGRSDAAVLAGAVADALAAARSAGATPHDFRTVIDAIRAIADDRPAGDIAALAARLTGAPASPLPPNWGQAVAVSPIPSAWEQPWPGETPTPSPPPNVPASVISDSHAHTLLELFREEVRHLSAALSGGLVELEANPDPRAVEPLMRAAHSIKGAARIVGCDPAVDLAHVMEELLVTCQHGKRAITAADIDPMLGGVDLLARMADLDLRAWAESFGPQARAATDALRARLAGEAVPARVADSLRESAAPETGTRGASAPPYPRPAPAPTVTSEAAPAPAAGEPADRVVRIGAQSLTRLLSLAGESLVEARWLQPFARSLFRLKKYQDHLSAVLDDLHEVLKTTATSDRVSSVAADARGRVADCRRVLADRIDEFEGHARQSDDLNSRLYREVIASRMRPFADGTHGLARMVRDVGRQLGKAVRFEVAGKDTDVDRDILDKLEAPLGHMLRNALDHGLESAAERAAAGKPETGTLRIEARHHAGMLNITVADDGRGIDPERLRRKVVERNLTTADMAARLSDAELFEFMFLPGFSTADAVTAVSGRGVGLDVVQATAQAVGGTIRVSSRLGRGTTFELQLPITLSVVRAVLVKVAGDPYAVPLNRTDRLLQLPADRIRTLEGKPHFEADGRHVGLVPARQVFALSGGEPPGDELCVVLVGDRSHQYGLVVDGFLGEQDLVVRPLDPRLGKVPNVAAAALLDDGSPVLIADVDDMIRSAAGLVQDGKLRHQPPAPTTRRTKRVLVVDDSAIVREAERQMLAGRGYDVQVAVDGVDGLNAARAGGFDLIVSDIDMPRMTGLELVRAIRADPKLHSTPVVVVSYKDRDEDRVRGLDAGADYYLTKSSFHDGQFLAAVTELIGGPDAP